MKKSSSLLLAMLIVVFFCPIVAAQPVYIADFDADPLEGCAPLEVTFTDQSSGPNLYAWTWFFGDGGTSSLQNPIHTYTSAGSYACTLVVSFYTDIGILLDTAAATITVYPAPDADFSGNPLEACVNEDVCFTDLSTGLILSWDWTFGDGGTSTEPSPCHTYTVPGIYTVSLTVDDEFGCGPDTETKEQYIIIHPEPDADFSADPLEACENDEICFTDLSTGEPNSWEWDFGDGGTSTDQDPCHTYTQAGTYTVSLTVNNAYDCGPDTETKEVYITIYPNPIADFEGTPLDACAPEEVCFTDFSTGEANSWSWDFGDGGTSTEQNPCYTYTAAGTYAVTLTVNNVYGCGPATETKQEYIVIRPVPDADFSADPLEACEPGEICFTDLSTGEASSWFWEFGDGGTSQLQNPCYTYQVAGDYTVSLTVDNVYQCGPDTETKEVYIVIHPTPVAEFEGAPLEGCAPEEVCFLDRSTGEPDSWFWDFGDGATSVLQSPCHTYQAAGTYTVSLIVNNEFDCGPDTLIKEQYVDIWPIPDADFTATPRNGCAPLDVTFTDLSSEGLVSWFWEFGDGGTSTEQNPKHIYQNAGTYTVSLTVYDEAKCGPATETKVAYIVVEEGPTADFSGTPRSGCTPLRVCFTNLSSENVDSWRWNFGDGGTSTAKNPCHTYTQPGTYTVSLTATNECGSDTETKVAYIFVDEVPTAAFLGTPRDGCAELQVCFTDQSTENTDSWSWNFGDGSTSTAQNPCHTYRQAGTYTVSLRVSNMCGSDTETKVDYITVEEAPTADFSGTPREGCSPLEVCFTDKSSSNAATWNWTFGDGNTSTLQHPCHTYQNPGTYTVSLTVSNKCGSDAETKAAYIVIEQGPEADFTGTPLEGCAPLAVHFADNSSGEIIERLWDFGDGSTSTEKNPTHTYQAGGMYNVSLTVTNSCGSDTETKTAYVTVRSGPVADFTSTFNGCKPPADVCFTDNSEGNPTSWSWDFGDGGTSTEQNPCHTYQTAGTYTVTLTVWNECGSDAKADEDITIGIDPEAKFKGTPRQGCAPLLTCFTDQSPNNPTSWSWEFGDGGTSSEQNPCHTYQLPGTYTVSLVVANECGLSAQTVRVYITVGEGVAAPVLVSPIGGAIISPGDELCWTEVDGATKYWVQFDDSPNFTVSLVHEDLSVISLCDRVLDLDDASVDYYWRVKAWNSSCGWSEWSNTANCRTLETGIIESESLEPPTAFELSQNYPNPFNPSTTIMFSVPESGPVSMVVYDILGREVTTLIAGAIMSPGVQSVTWDGLDAKGTPVPGGIYFYRMTAGDFVKTHKMLLLK